MQNTPVFENNAERINVLAYKYRDFPIYRAPEVTINAASQALPVLILAALFGPASAGYYTLARTVMSLPALLMGKSIADVLYSDASAMANFQKRLYPKIKNITLLMTCIGIVPFGIVFLFGPVLFKFFFGDEWGGAGEYAGWLAISLFAIFITNPLIRVAPVINAQKIVFYYNLLFSALKVFLVYCSYVFFKNDIVCLMSVVMVDSLMFLFLGGNILIRFKSFDRN